MVKMRTKRKKLKKSVQKYQSCTFESLGSRKCKKKGCETRISNVPSLKGHDTCYNCLHKIWERKKRRKKIR